MSALEIEKLLNVMDIIRVVSGAQAEIAEQHDLEEQVNTRYSFNLQQPANHIPPVNEKQARKESIASLFDEARNEMVYNHVEPTIAPRWSVKWFKNTANEFLAKTKFHFAANANLGIAAVELVPVVARQTNILPFVRRPAAA